MQGPWRQNRVVSIVQAEPGVKELKNDNPKEAAFNLLKGKLLGP